MWSLILKILMALPSLIKVVVELWKLISSLTAPEEKVAYEEKLRDTLWKGVRERRKTRDIKADLENLKSEVSSKV